MRALPAAFLALLLLCTCACVLLVWSGLDGAADMGVDGRAVEPGSRADLSPKTFRALLAVAGLQRERGGGTPHVESESEPDLDLALRDELLWPERLDALLPEAFGEAHARAWALKARRSAVVSLEPGCGRASNRLATFADGTRACVRYGITEEQVQGETLSFYLAALLGIRNLPPLALSQLDPESERWAAVRGAVHQLGWSWGAVVSLTEWVANLTGVVTPAPLRQHGAGLRPLREELRNRSVHEVLELVQWSDLVLFDYLTANFDRLVSGLFSLQWDARVMERDASNLQRTPRGALLLLDNEAGLVHGYRVLPMWEGYHGALLRSVCLFRESTARRVAELQRARDAGARLRELYVEGEPLARALGFLSDEHERVLQDRVDRVHRHIVHCKERHGRA
ncbi:four-jointed box protein 1-like [Scleropages formosus]|uniref:Four-jointed box kinase 1 n=1 Tax=Scleropages formosus TaxID=113540 RepID=A0A8D0CDB5_SCLFO|nr:four-jointed box protein 1 [Scleropages formosus]